MLKHSRSLLRRSAQFARRSLQPVAPAVRNVGSRAHRTSAWSRLSLALAIVLSGSMSMVLLASGYAKFEMTHPRVRPLVTGTDGSQTGIASFQGDFTAIANSSSNLFLLQRQADCSLSLITANSTTSGSIPTFTITGNTPHYERTLHQLASLTTTSDTYPHGCVEKNTGISTRTGVFVGVPQAAAGVSAQVVSNGSGNAVRTRIYSNSYAIVSQNIEASLTSASAVTTADLNGDGNGDLVIVNSSLATTAFISVMIGNPDGTFKTPINYTIAGNYSVAAVIDDVNGDGKLDLIVASDDQHISVLTGNGDGTFNAAQSFSAPCNGSANPLSTPILALITADLRNSGKKDIICSNGLILLGNGDGTFNPVSAPAFPYVQNLTSGYGPGLASGDLNNDGKLDLVVSTGATISTWIGNADGTFTRGPSYPPLETWATSPSQTSTATATPTSTPASPTAVSTAATAPALHHRTSSWETETAHSRAHPISWVPTTAPTSATSTATAPPTLSPTLKTNTIRPFPRSPSSLETAKAPSPQPPPSPRPPASLEPHRPSPRP